MDLKYFSVAKQDEWMYYHGTQIGGKSLAGNNYNL
jgi:hypothetical protein